MDIFILDKIIIGLVKAVIASPMLQFSTLTGIWVILEVALPSKKGGKKQ